MSEATRGDDDQFGEERIACLAAAHAGAPLTELIGKIEREVEGFTGERTFHDDFTLLAARHTG